MCLGRNVYLLENIAKTYCTVYGWKICTVCVQQPPYSITDAKPRGCKTPGTPDFLACVLQKVSVNGFASPLTVGQMIISWQIANFLQMSKLQHFCHNPKKFLRTSKKIVLKQTFYLQFHLYRQQNYSTGVQSSKFLGSRWRSDYFCAQFDSALSRIVVRLTPRCP